jgi:hypothetical protein
MGVTPLMAAAGIGISTTDPRLLFDGDMQGRALASPEVLVKAGADVKRADNRHQQSHYAYRAIQLRYRSIGPDRALRTGQPGNAAQSMRPTPDGRVMATSPHGDVKKSSIPLYKTLQQVARDIRAADEGARSSRRVQLETE